MSDCRATLRAWLMLPDSCLRAVHPCLQSAAQMCRCEDLQQRAGPKPRGLRRSQALEALRKLKAEKLQQAKEFKLRLEHLKTHKNNADRLAEERDGNTQRAREAQDRIAQLQQDIEARLCIAATFHSSGTTLETRHNAT